MTHSAFRLFVTVSLLFTSLISPAVSRADSIVRYGPPKDIAAVAALVGTVVRVQYKVENVAVVGDTAYADYVMEVVGGQLFAKKINGKWKIVATGGDDAPSPADWAARSHRAISIAQICTIDLHLGRRGQPGCPH